MANPVKTKDSKQQVEYVDLLALLQILKNRKKVLVIGLIIGALTGWALSTFVVQPKYSSFVDLYITNTNKVETGAVDYNDINAAQKLVSTYVVILQSNQVTQDVLSDLRSDMSSEELLSKTTFTSVQNTEVLRISVETKDPQLTTDICNSYMKVAQTALDSVVGAGYVKVISKPIFPESPSYPSISKFTAIGALMGLLLMVALSLGSLGVNRPISDDKMLTERYPIPVLGAVPDFFLYSKALNITKQDIKKNQKLKAKNPNNEKIITSATILNDNTPFQITEAYNGIRSNILFSLANMKNGILLVTSPNANELKTTTSINLAISMAHIGAKVLLIDCDLRNPSIYRHFKLSNKMGLSRVITGFDSFERSLVKDLVPGVDFLSSGPSTPRPSELLGSSVMLEFLKIQALNYDFVILDTSPLNVVSDSLALSSVAAGMILVARENITLIKDIDRCINSIKMANGNIMGFVLTDVDSSKGGYGYGKYGYGKYGYGYGYGNKRNDKDKTESLNYNSEVSMNSSYLNAFRRRKRKILISELKEDENNNSNADGLMDNSFGLESINFWNNNPLVTEPNPSNPIETDVASGNSSGTDKAISEKQALDSFEMESSKISYKWTDQSTYMSSYLHGKGSSAAPKTADYFDFEKDYSKDFSSQTMDGSEFNPSPLGAEESSDYFGSMDDFSKDASNNDQSASSENLSQKNISVPGNDENKKNRDTLIMIVFSLIVIALCIVSFIILNDSNSHDEDQIVPASSEIDVSSYNLVSSEMEGLSSEESADDVSSNMESTTDSTSEVSTDVTTINSPYSALSPGTRNDDVKKMQLRLASLGYLPVNSCTGYYGKYTETHLMEFQKNAGLAETGIADSVTLARLYADDAPRA